VCHGIAALISSAVVAASMAVCIVAYLSRTACLAASAAVASDGMVALMSNGANSADRAVRLASWAMVLALVNVDGNHAVYSHASRNVRSDGMSATSTIL
jgi:hypothetical protein